MPNFDRTGPTGQGPMTGRGMGLCNAAQQGIAPFGMGRGPGFGYGRGPGFGYGRGLGYGMGRALRRPPR